MAEKKNRVGPADLGITLDKRSDAQLFRWLVACALFGARISQEIAGQAHRELDKDGLLTPGRLANADWQVVVDALGRGGYRRYDESTARELIELGERVEHEYSGRLSRLDDGVTSKTALSRRLQEFKGVGPTAARIFLRETEALWDFSKGAKTK